MTTRLGTLCFIAVLSACSKPDAASAQVPPTSPPAQGPVGDPPTVESTKEKPREVAVLAGGCFWGMEDIIRKVPGVIDTEVGYTGGGTRTPGYEQVKTGRTGHAEAVKVVFDPTKISYAELLERWFFRMHDPTTKDRQGNDIGTQYRSAIFYVNPEQEKTAKAVIAKVDKAGYWKKPIVTQVVAAGEFTAAEGYHQDYLVRNPGGYTCHYMREFQTSIDGK